MANPAMKGDYCLQVSFERGAQNPSAIFQTMSDLIEVFQGIDRDLAFSVSAEIDPILVLQEVEAGSIKAWLSSVIRSVNDEALAKLDWKAIVGSYLLQGKKKVLQCLDGKTTVSSLEEIKVLQGELLSLAEQTEVLKIPTYAPVPAKVLLSTLERMSDSLQSLGDNNEASLILNGVEHRVNKQFRIPPETIQLLLTQESISNQSDVILKVKKPDFLGQSMWEYRHQKHSFLARMEDLEWLRRFQRRDILVHPGDSIRARLETTASYDQSGEVIALSYTILKVLEVIPLQGIEQGHLPLDFHDDD